MQEHSLVINKVRHTTVAVLLNTDRIIKLLSIETIPRDAIILSIHTRRDATARLTIGGKTIVNDACFNAAFLHLKKKQEEVVEAIPFEQIETCSNVDPVKGFQVNLSDVDWNTSFIEVVETVTLDTGNYFEMTFAFILPPTK